MSIGALQWHEIDQLIFMRIVHSLPKIGKANEREMIQRFSELLWLKHEIRMMANLPTDQPENRNLASRVRTLESV